MMNPFKSWIPCILAVSAVYVDASWAADLKPKYEAGAESYYIRTLSKTETGKIGGGQAMAETHHNTELGIRVRVVQAQPDGSATLECTILYIDRAEVSGSSSDTYDSRSRGAKPPTWAIKLREYLNKPVVLAVGKDGNVTAVSGLPGTSGKVNRFEELTSETAYKQLALFATAGAAQPVAAGATWSTTSEQPVGSSTSVLVEKRDYKIESLGDSVVISISSNIESKENEKAAKEDSNKMRVVVREGHRKGQLSWDVGSGQLADFKSESLLKLSQMMPGAPENMSIDVEQKAGETLQRCKLEEFKLPVPTTRPTKPDMQPDSAPAGAGGSDAPKPDKDEAKQPGG